MKICMLVTNNFINDSRVIREAVIAKENGFGVTVIGKKSPAKAPGKPPPDGMRLILCEGIGGKSLPAKLISCIILNIRFILQILKLKPKIIHANDLDTLAAGYIGHLLTGAALIYDCHDIWYASHPELPGFILSLARRFEGFAARRCSCVFSINRGAAEYLAKVHRIPEPVVVQNYPFSDPRVRSVTPSPGRFTILYHGLISKSRGLETLIRSAKSMNPQISIVIRGFGPLLEELKEEAERISVEDRVEFAPPVAPEDLSFHAAAANAGVVLTEPISANNVMSAPNKLFEYIMAGIPVILSDTPENRRLVKTYGFGIVIDRVTPESLAQAVNFMSTNPDFYEVCRQNAQKAREELCWEKESMKLIEAYNKAAQI